MSGGGLYLLRYDQRRRTLHIALYSGEAVKAVLTDDSAQDVYEHFRTIADHAIRDSFIDGVLMGLRVPGPIIRLEEPAA